MKKIKHTPLSLFGKLFDKSGFIISNNGQELMFFHKMPSKNSEINQFDKKIYRISTFEKFATIAESFLGSKVTININSNTVITSKYLEKKTANAFVDALNNLIANNVKFVLEELNRKFIINTVSQYPRESFFLEIIPTLALFSEKYITEILNIKKYLTPEYYQASLMYISYHANEAEIKQLLRKQYENKILNERKKFYDTIESNPLTEDQRLGVIRSDDRNMVLAAAGTGKTSVIVAKSLDIIDRALAKPDEILVLAYNKSAAVELDERLKLKAENAGIKLTDIPHITTFHALGKRILKDANIETKLSVLAEDDLKLNIWITKWLDDYLSISRDNILEVMSFFPTPVNTLNFETQKEYEDYVRDNELRTLKGDKVRSYEELAISNWMYINQIPYKYEDKYVSKRRIEMGFDYSPDFHIENTNIYVEHFGISRDGSTRPDIDAAKYNKEINQKRILHNECDTILIETFHYEYIERILFDNLEKNLAKHNIFTVPLQHDEILNELKSKGNISAWSKILNKALKAIRTERLSETSILKRLHDAKIPMAENISNFLTKLHDAYVHELSSQGTIDFDDMIIRAISTLNEKKFLPNWKYILVDEFQDISEARMDFIKTIISNSIKPSLTVVGDDWQSIYRFSGGKLELTTRFDSLVGSYTQTTLQKTFRYHNNIADVAGTFIMENPEQYKKNIKTHQHVDAPQIYHYCYNAKDDIGLYEKVVNIINDITKEDANGSIAIISRYNNLLDNTCKKVSFALSKAVKNKISYWTFHRSKGQEADYCILIGLVSGKTGFPNNNKDDIMIEALLPAMDSYPHSEERRLMYVGLTRAKKKLYLLTDELNPSDFSNELLGPKYNSKIKIVSQELLSENNENFKCPYCKNGHLALINGKYGNFYSCNNRYACKSTTIRACSKCNSPLIDGKNDSVCINNNCRHSIRICEKCGRQMVLREGMYGQFWGCIGYSAKDDQCSHTEKC